MIAISEGGALWVQATLLLAILNIRDIRKVTARIACDHLTGALIETCKCWAGNRVTDTTALHAAVTVCASITIIARRPLKLWFAATTCSTRNSLEALTMHTTRYVGAGGHVLVVADATAAGALIICVGIQNAGTPHAIGQGLKHAAPCVIVASTDHAGRWTEAGIRAHTFHGVSQAFVHNASALSCNAFVTVRVEETIIAVGTFRKQRVVTTTIVRHTYALALAAIPYWTLNIIHNTYVDKTMLVEAALGLRPMILAVIWNESATVLQSTAARN